MEESISGVRGQLAVNIFGNDLDILVQKGNQLDEIMRNIPGVTDVGVEQTLGILQLNMLVDREHANRYGLNAKMIGDAVETAMGGRVVTTVVKDIKEYDVLVRLQERFRDDPEKIGALLIDTPNGNKVKLSSVCKIWRDTGPLSIKRENMQRRIQVTCNISHRNIGSIVSDIQNHIKELSLPAGYYVTFGGNYERQQELTRQLVTIFIVSAIVVFMLLLAAFRSVWQAFLLIVFIPFALMGGVWALFLTGNTFNISSLIGMVAHFGLTVEKGIIMLEFINELRKEGRKEGRTSYSRCVILGREDPYETCPDDGYYIDCRCCSPGNRDGRRFRDPTTYGNRPHWRSYYINTYYPYCPARRL
ncbi:MAG: efflux RND transporter permease subunit [Candidatus Brocadiaceae bacterium]